MDGQGGRCGTAGHRLVPGTRRCEVCGRDLAARVDGRSLVPASDPSDPSSGHSDEDARSRVRERAALLGAVVLVAAGALLGSADDRDWPQGCGVDGRAEWCAEPSTAMTEPAVLSLVRGYCPRLANIPLQDVAPQPLSQLGLASEQALAMTSGSDRDGTEDALLGRSGEFARVTRWIGGESDGRLEVRCFSDPRVSASIRLEADQFRSTVAAAGAADAPYIDFTEVARQSLPAASGIGFGRMSFRSVTCDTTDIDLDDPATGSTFFCVTKVHGRQGTGGYRAIYQVVPESPYFESVPAGYACTAYAGASAVPRSASTDPMYEISRCSTWRFARR